MEVGREPARAVRDIAGYSRPAPVTVMAGAEPKLLAAANSGDRPAKRERSKVASNGMTYADWLTKAIESGTDRRLMLAEIYDWMVVNVPGLSGQRYLHSSKGWKNAVRHTLSVNPRFCKIARPGRPSYWAVALSTTSAPPASDAAQIDSVDTKSRKRATSGRSSPTSLLVDESVTGQKRLKSMPSPLDHGPTSVVSTTSVTPPARTPQVSETSEPSTCGVGNSDPAAACYVLEYYQIPLALLAEAAMATRAFAPKPSSGFRTSPTSAFVSWRPRQEAKG